ncbi:hypothetical protein [Candidatus Pelagibacter sp. Uisw_127]|uniref:hypothetical protein n=1 Tax=Candidatus Pelagibacter sp. Uisw_127 TaxID=3230988 RepID=UPI0039EAE776
MKNPNKAEIENFRQNFKDTGVVHLKSFFSNEELEEIIENSKDIINKAKTGKWRFIKVYNSYPIFKNKINIFGISLPLNKSLNEKIYDNFQKINFKDCILDILKWKNFKTTLVRLHSSSPFYNYQGVWHRDDECYPTPNKIRLIVYLKDEEGFRIIPKNKNDELKKFGVSIDKQINSINGLDEFPKNLYIKIKASKGDIVIFESGLAHQGFVKKERIHWHFGFEKFDTTNNISMDDNYNFVEKLKSKYDCSKEVPTRYSFKPSFYEKISRIKSFIFYFFPRLRSIKSNVLKNGNKKSIFHSTIWQ